MKEQITTKPARLPPAVGVAGTRQTTPATVSYDGTSLVPLSPLTSPPRSLPQRKASYTEMPPPSAVLLASRPPSTGPHGSARRGDECSESDKTLETYALRIHEATTKKRMAPPARNRVFVSVGAKPTRRVVTVATLVPASRTTNNQRDPPPASPHANKSRTNDPLLDDARHVNAGVYVLENRKTGHRFVGTTWDLRNAAAQSFADLRDGVHPHHALATCFQLYGKDASGIVFRVLERVALPVAYKTNEPHAPRRPRRGKKTAEDPTFDVHAMETLLSKRRRFHEREIVRKCARSLVQRRLVRPLLARFWPIWIRHTLEMPRAHELLAAAVVVQSVVRMFLAARRAERRRKQRAAIRIAKFFALCAMKRVLCKRRDRKRRHASAMRIQNCVKRYLQRYRQATRAQLVKKWLAARTIQRVFRGHCGRRAVHRICVARLQDESAVRLQSLARGFLVRCRVHHKRHAEMLHRHSVQIQSCWRGYYTRQFVYAPLQQTRKLTQRQEDAVRRLQEFYRRYFVRHKLTRAARQHALEVEQGTRIHAAYRNYLAKKFGWAAMTYKLEQMSAIRIQKAMRRWFFFARIAGLVELERREKASLCLQRVYRGFQGRRIARDCRIHAIKDRSAGRLQRVWRLSQAFTKLHAAIMIWRVDKSARLIQARYRGFHRRRVYLVFRDEARRQRAATRIQSSFRRYAARRVWRRRMQLHRDGIACQECGDVAASLFSLQLSMELCESCAYRWHERVTVEHDESLVELGLFKRQQRLATNAQRVFRGFQARKIVRFGACALCELRAVRVACRVCPGTRKLCHTCDALFHRITPTGKPHVERLRIEEFVRQQNAAVLLQKHVRRYAHRHTITSLRHRRQTVAAVKIQTVYASRRQRRQTRALVAARYELAFQQQRAARVIQQRVRIFLARCLLHHLRARKNSAMVIQRVFRGHMGRVDANRRRKQRDAAVCIQRHIRGVHGRRRADRRREEIELRKQLDATVELQRHARGWLVRRRLWHKRRSFAALVIQTCWRRNRAKRILFNLIRDRNERLRLEAEARARERLARQLEVKRVAAICVQCAWRRHCAREELIRLRVASAKQKRMEQLSIWIAVERKSAMRIQKFVRRKWLTQAASSSLVLQCNIRQWLARRELRRLRTTRKAAISIQRAFRYSRAKRKLTRLVSLESFAVAGTVGGWVELFDEESGCVYYYNRETMASQWVKPPEMMGESPDAVYLQQQPQLGELDPNEPPEWVEYWDDNVGASYFYNTRTGEATWATPEGVTSNQSQEDPSQWAWPPGAPFDGKLKHGDQKYAQATDYSNQAETDAVNPAQAYYVDENGNAYEYDYSAYDYSAYAYANGYAVDGAQESQASGAGGYTLQTGEGFDESPVDTSYDINYQIFMTQMQRDAERQNNDHQEQDQ